MTKHTYIPPIQRNKRTFVSTMDIVKINVIGLAISCATLK